MSEQRDPVQAALNDQVALALGRETIARIKAQVEVNHLVAQQQDLALERSELQGKIAALTPKDPTPDEQKEAA
jgi:hypothetical protein